MRHLKKPRYFALGKLLRRISRSWKIGSNGMEPQYCHSDYFIKRGAEYNAPYFMLSNSVHRKSEILPRIRSRCAEENDAAI